jgi:hypothetical protein
VNELAEIAATDRAFRRFGASRHRYEMAAPIEVDLDADVPDDYRRFVATIGSGGAGPYYGLVEAPRAIAHVVDGPWGHGIPIGHLGCGYAAILSLAGPVWICARSIGVVREIRPSFTAYYVTWLAQLAANELPEAFVPPGVCPLPTALGGYLGVCEQQLGLAPGTIAGEALADALARLPPGGIEIAAEDARPLFADGDRVDPCVACAVLLDNLGLARTTVAPGLTPRL